VNKLDNIDVQFRFFKMEVLAGEPDFVVDHVILCYLVKLQTMLTPFLLAARVELSVCLRFLQSLLEFSAAH